MPIVRAETPCDLVLRCPQQAHALLDIGHKVGGGWGLKAGDAIARNWLRKVANPYEPELARMAAFLERPGVYALNSSYEWLCTTGVGLDPEGGMRMIRVLDWRMSGLGKACVLADQHGAAGRYINATWPGFVGVLTAMAPGRFAAAINQAPMRSYLGGGSRLSWPVDWMRGRYRVWRSTALPPVHLLRRVFDECASYAEAKKMLMETPLCIPALFCLAGIEKGDGCVIERTEEACVVRDAPSSIANHWQGMPLNGRPRGHHGCERHDAMQAIVSAGSRDFYPDLPFPIINNTTRLIFVANPARGCLIAQGWEKTGPVTAPTIFSAA